MAERGRRLDASVRLAQRRRDRRRRRVVRALIAVLVVGLVATAAWTVFVSSALAATKVVVTGTSVLTPDEVVAAAKVPLGTPLARLDTKAVADRVRALTQVADVTVTRSVPHTVRIAVTERTGVYVVSSAGGFDVVDATGVAFTSVASVPQGLIVATITGDNARLRRDVATVVVAMPQPLRARAVLITADTPDDIVIELQGGAEVVWGSAESSAQKAQVIGALLNVKASVYDVSAPSHPTTRG